MHDHAIGGPGPDVRRDEGGWISGPCLREPAEGGRRGRYYIEAEAEDRRLEDRLAAIRSREDAGTIATRQAADERIAVMEQHLAAVRELCKQHLEGRAR
jgi:hypothetical protein